MLVTDQRGQLLHGGRVGAGGGTGVPPPDTETVLVTDGWTLFATATVSVIGG